MSDGKWRVPDDVVKAILIYAGPTAEMALVHKLCRDLLDARSVVEAHNAKGEPVGWQARGWIVDRWTDWFFIPECSKSAYENGHSEVRPVYAGAPATAATAAQLANGESAAWQWFDDGTHLWRVCSDEHEARVMASIYGGEEQKVRPFYAAPPVCPAIGVIERMRAEWAREGVCERDGRFYEGAFDFADAILAELRKGEQG